MRRSGGRAALEAQAASGPRVRVAALIEHEGRVVTVRHRSGDTRYHLLPGGGVGYRETLADALVREVLEETGLRVSLGRPVLLSDTIEPEGPRHVVNILFLAQVVGGEVTEAPADARVEAVDLVAIDELQELDLRPPWADSIARLLTEDAAPCAEYLGPLFTVGRKDSQGVG